MGVPQTPYLYVEGSLGAREPFLRWEHGGGVGGVRSNVHPDPSCASHVGGVRSLCSAWGSGEAMAEALQRRLPGAS